MRCRKKATASAAIASLPDDILANIHGRLSLLDRLAFTAVFHASSAALKPEMPWLLLRGRTPETATLFSLSDRCSTTVSAPEPALRGHVVLGSSSDGWLVTADDRAKMRIVNPVTGEQRVLPAITTIPCLFEQHGRFVLDLKRFGRAPPHPVYDNRPSDWTYRIPAQSMCAKSMRSFCRKVVLSNSPPCPAAMMITGTQFGFVAFATAKGGTWRLARNGADLAKTVCGTTPLPDGVEDAIHYEGRFYSITYSGQVEAWEHDADDSGVFKSVVVAPRLLLPANLDHRRYLVGAPGGRLMVVVREATHGYQELLSFKVQVLDAGGEEWRETDDIGDAALFVGGKSSLCVTTREYPELKAGCIYYANEGYVNEYDARANRVKVFSLKDSTAEKVEGLRRRQTSPRPAWFTPCFP
ncbi:hypothetical protein ACQJBY_013177 [Aegilops geniculata]